MSKAGCLALLISDSDLIQCKLDFVRYFSDVKDDKHTIETCFHNGNVRFFSLICEIGGSRFTVATF